LQYYGITTTIHQNDSITFVAAFLGLFHRFALGGSIEYAIIAGVSGGVGVFFALAHHDVKAAVKKPTSIGGYVVAAIALVLLIGGVIGLTVLTAEFLPPLAALALNQALSMYVFQRFFSAMK
jgi:hypothetical protein